MVWQIKPFSHRCHVTGAVFEDGACYASLLLVDPKGELVRYDILADQEKDFVPEGDILCRWRQRYRKEPERNESARRQRETAETLFLSLFQNPGGETGAGEKEGTLSNGGSGISPDEGEILKKFLGLLLERKRILRPRGISPDGRFRLMEHGRNKSIYPVPTGDLTPDEFLGISDRLGELVKQP